MERVNILTAYKKTLTSDAFFVDLYNFSQQYEVDIPFLADYMDAKNLDLYYFYSWAGQKLISNMVNAVYGAYEPEEIAISDRNQIAALFWQMFGDNILKQWANYTKEYDSTENYHMIESETSSDTNSGVDTSRESYPEYKEILKQNHIVYTDSKSGIYGLDSGTDGANSDRVNSETEITTHPRTQGAEELEGDTKEIEGSKVNTLEHGKKVDGTRETEKTGTMPVGEGTIQGMISKDIELWQWNFYTKYLFPMVDKVLALPIY